MILLDDVGLRRLQRVRRPVRHADCRAAGRRRAASYTRFHTTALCSPTRAGAADRPQPPLGRHGRHHRDGHRRRPATTRSGRRPRRRWPRRCGSTATPPRSSASATRCRCGRPARWARSTTGRPAAGFEYFYGFVGGETNQYYPALYEGTTPVEPPKTPEEGYHLTEDLADQAIDLGAPAEGAACPTSRSSCTSRPAPPTRRTTSRRSGPTSTRASSTPAGTRCARRPSPGRRNSA